MPYIEEANLDSVGDPNLGLSNAVNQQVRRAFVKAHECPSDIGLQQNEWGNNNWARVRSNYVVNAGNTVYGQHDVGAPCPGTTAPRVCWFSGAPFRPRKVGKIGRITDGTSNTLMMSEVLVLPSTPGWGGPYSDAQTALGGQVFTGWNTPNTGASDHLCRQGEWYTPDVQVQQAFVEQGLPRPVVASVTMAAGFRIPAGGTVGGETNHPEIIQDSNGHKQQTVAARSKHTGGVNAVKCDGSVDFYSDSIEPYLWNALTSAWGEEPLGALN
jgi:hypothetical protein